MRIKKRSVSSSDAPVAKVDDMPKFPNIEAKPKKPVEDTGFFSGSDRIPGQNARRFGLIAQACGDAPADISLSVADRFKLLRTPYDTTTATEQRYRNRVRNRQTAITAFCVTCTGSRKGVTECAAVTCPLWAFRLGSNPYRTKR
jgi:hypothetical protein